MWENLAKKVKDEVTAKAKYIVDTETNRNNPNKMAVDSSRCRKYKDEAYGRRVVIIGRDNYMPSGQYVAYDIYGSVMYRIQERKGGTHYIICYSDNSEYASIECHSENTSIIYRNNNITGKIHKEFSLKNGITYMVGFNGWQISSKKLGSKFAVHSGLSPVGEFSILFHLNERYVTYLCDDVDAGLFITAAFAVFANISYCSQQSDSKASRSSKFIDVNKKENRKTTKKENKIIKKEKKRKSLLDFITSDDVDIDFDSFDNDDD